MVSFTTRSKQKVSQEGHGKQSNCFTSIPSNHEFMISAKLKTNKQGHTMSLKIQETITP